MDSSKNKFLHDINVGLVIEHLTFNNGVKKMDEMANFYAQNGFSFISTVFTRCGCTVI